MPGHQSVRWLWGGGPWPPVPPPPPSSYTYEIRIYLQPFSPTLSLFLLISLSVPPPIYMYSNRYNPQLSYFRSKLANVMFARELAKQIKGSSVTVCSLHPGCVYTEITRYFLSGWLIILKVYST